jgi:hypothetical protein
MTIAKPRDLGFGVFSGFNTSCVDVRWLWCLVAPFKNPLAGVIRYKLGERDLYLWIVGIQDAGSYSDLRGWKRLCRLVNEDVYHPVSCLLGWD